MNKARLLFAWRGASASRNEFWAPIFGGLIGWGVCLLVGWQATLPAAIADNFVASAVIAGPICLLIAQLFVFVGRFAYWPIHLLVDPYGGIVQLARSKLGSLMAPIALIVAALFSFVTLFTAGVVWLLLKMPTEIAKSSPLVSAAARQPALSLVVPDRKLILKWDVNKSTEILFRYEGDDGPEFTTPYVLAKIDNDVSIADVTIKWRIELSDLIDLIKRSKVMSVTNKDFETDRVSISSNGQGGYSYRTNPTDAPVAVPFINKDTKIYMPLNVYDITRLYLLSQIPEGNGMRSAPLVITVFVHWNIPDGGRDQTFRMTATVTNNRALPVSSSASGSVDIEMARVD